MLTIAGGLLAFFADLRFFRAIAPSDDTQAKVVALALVVVSVAVGLGVTRLRGGGLGLTAAAAGAVPVAAAAGIDALATNMALVPISLAAVVVLGGLTVLYVRDS